MSSRATEHPDTLPPEALLTIRQTAKLLRGADRYVRELLSSGELKSIPWGRAGEPRIPRWCVRQWQERIVHDDELRVRSILTGFPRMKRQRSRCKATQVQTADHEQMGKVQ